MKDIIISMYENENFPIILGIIILLLFISFIIVIFLDKKSSNKKSVKEEKTDIKQDTMPLFKEEKEDIIPFEIDEHKDEIYPIIKEEPKEKEEVIIPKESEEIISYLEDTSEKTEPLTKEISDDTIALKLESLKNITNTINDELTSLENMKSYDKEKNKIDMLYDEDDIELPKLK